MPNTVAFTSRAETLNAKAAAVSLALSAFMLLLLSHFSVPLTPLRLLTLAFSSFGVWAFCDEMGLRKPLNRAGATFFAIAMFTKVQIVLGLSETVVGRYYLLYTAFLCMAVLLWSVAFLHREPTLKKVGAVGLIASLLPIAAIIIGHIVIGAGAFFGVESLLSAAEHGASPDLAFVTWVERIFGLWAYVAAWLLWRGHIRASVN